MTLEKRNHAQRGVWCVLGDTVHGYTPQRACTRTPYGSVALTQNRKRSGFFLAVSFPASAVEDARVGQARSTITRLVG
jgi:hypothetical protein